MATITRHKVEFSSWVVLMVLFWATGIVESQSWTQFGAFTPLYLQQLGVRSHDVPNWVAAMAALSSLIGIPLAPFWGVLADRYSRKAVIVRSAVVEAILFLGWAYAQDPWTALAFRALSGFVLGNTGVMLAVQASVTPRERLGLAVGVIGAGGPAGAAVGPLLGAGLIHLGGIRGMLLADAVASVAIAVLLTILIREPVREKAKDLHPLAALAGALRFIGGSTWVWRLFLATFLALAASWICRPLLPILIARQAGPQHFDSTTAIGVVLTTMALAQALASPFWGRLVDRFGAVRVLVASSVVGALALAGAAVATDLRLLGMLLTLFGAASGAAAITNMALLARIVPDERRGSVLGLIYFPFYAAGLVGPPIGAVLFPGGQAVLLLASAVATLLPLAVVYTLRRVPFPTPQ